MIDVQEAKEKIRQGLRLLPTIRAPLEQCLHRILACDIRAPIPLPLYDNSAMDGFALSSEDTQLASLQHLLSLHVTGTQRAGDPPGKRIRPGQCIRIMTGATIPKGADAVVMKEAVTAEAGRIFISKPIPLAANIRKRGEEIRKGNLVLPAGTLLSSRAIGLLANLGLKEIPVRKTPRIALIVTGSELISPGKKPHHGQIYDSNTPMLLSALREIHLEACFVRRVSDDEKKLKSSLAQALRKADVVLLVGGVSVGDYDFSKSVLAELGVKTIFWKVAQKPGKPLFFGKKAKKLVFGLPGNPVSVWICFHEYVRSALLAMQGFRKPGSLGCHATLEGSVKTDASKTLLLKGWTQGHNGCSIVRPLHGQGSHMLKALAEANCLIQVPPQAQVLPSGSDVEIHPLSPEVLR